MKKWMFNPFIYIAGTKALAIGWTVMIATAVIGYFSHAHFDGVLDLHNWPHATPLVLHLLEQLNDWLMLTIVFFVAGKLSSNSSIRLIDVAGTMALARWVAIVPAIMGFGIHVPENIPHTQEQILAMITPLTIVLGLLSFVFIIWMVVLLYNAFAVSCNLKNGKATVPFIVGLILAEAASWTISHYCLKSIA